MANMQNLIPNSERTPEQLREQTRKGGIASGEARRKRKAFKEALLLALETKKGDKTIQEIGIDAVMEKYMFGDLEAFKVIRDTVGEKPTDKVDLGQEKPFEVKIEVIK